MPPRFECRTCPRSRRASDLLCSRCWSLVPEALQRAVYTTWQRGSLHQTDGYFAAVADAIEAVRTARGITTPPAPGQIGA